MSKVNNLLVHDFLFEGYRLNVLFNSKYLNNSCFEMLRCIHRLLSSPAYSSVLAEMGCEEDNRNIFQALPVYCRIVMTLTF